MKRRVFSFSIREMLVVTAVLSLPFATVVSGSQLLMNTFCTLTVLLFSLGIVGTCICQKSKRAFCLGMAVCGWIYLALELQTWDGKLPYFLLSSAFTNLVFRFVENRIETPFFTSRYEFLGYGMHFICAFLVGLTGGYAARWFFADDKPATQ
jgi:hypothetical protein